MMETLMVRDQRIELQRHMNVRPGRPVLIFLHEGLGCTRLWKNFPKELSEQCQCPALEFSRTGYGGSDPCPLPRKINFMHTEALRFLPDLLDAAGIRNHIVIGQSDGGSIGLIYGGSPHARALKGLITEAAHVFCEPITLSAIEQARQAYLHGNLKKKLERYHGSNTDTAFWGWNGTWLHPKFAHWNIEKYLSRIQVPVMAIQGRQDPYGTLAQVDAIGSKVPDCRTHIIENCGHTPHYEHKDQVLGMMARFINTLV